MAVEMTSDDIKSLPAWFVRMLLRLILAVMSITVPIAAWQSFSWVEKVSDHVATLEPQRLAALETRTDRIETVLTEMRIDQLSKYIWEAVRAGDKAKAAEWEVELRKLMLRNVLSNRPGPVIGPSPADKP